MPPLLQLDAFIDWCIEDAESEHTCESNDSGETE